MRILITGGTGFIGRCVTQCLRSRGHEIHVVSRSALRRPPPDLEDGVDRHGADFGDLAAMRALCDGTDVVVHLGWTTVPKNSSDNPGHDIQSNVLGTINLLEACAEAGTKKVVFSSTGGAVYGEARRLPVREDHPLEPISSYGITKLAAERYLHFYSQTRGLDYRILRISNAYGPGQPGEGIQGIIGIWIARIRSGKPLEVLGDGETVRDYVHVRDVADAFGRIVEGEAPSRVYNVGSGSGFSVNRLLKMIEVATGVESRVVRRPGRAFDVRRNVLDIARARSELGWRPTISLENGLSELCHPGARG